MITSDSFFISFVDHRISAAVVFSLLLFLLNKADRKRFFVPKALLSCVVMLAVCWGLRTFTESGCSGSGEGVPPSEPVPDSGDADSAGRY